MAAKIERFGFGSVGTSRRQRRAAAVHIADQVATQHPRLTAEELAADPVIAAGLRELLDALGLGLDTRRAS